MQAVKSLFESYFGIPPAEPGQGTQWEFAARSPWPEWAPPWLVLLMAAGLIGLVLSVYARDAKTLPLKASLALVALRLGVLALLMLFLTGLAVSIDQTGLPTAIVLLDTSASMGISDEFVDSQQREQVSGLLANADLNEPTRLNLAEAILTGQNADFLKRLMEGHKLRVYQFSDVPATVGVEEYTSPEDLAGLSDRLRRLNPIGQQTRPGPAVRSILTALRGMPPAALVVFTDGITTTTPAESLSSAAEFARSQGVPIFAVGIGSEESSRDVELYDVLVDDVAFVQDPVTFTGKLKAFGYSGNTATLTLKEKGSPDILASEEIALPKDGVPQTFELAYNPLTAGEFDYVLEVAPLPKETNLKNNAELRHVSVRDEKVRVLLVDSVPRYEYRFLKNLLERDPTVELTAILQDADLEYAEQDESAINRFPVKRSELFEQDVVVFGDVNLNEFSTGVLENLREFVRVKGGGLVLIAGPNHNPLSYRGTPLEILLPIELTDGAKAPEGPIVQSFRPELTVPALQTSTLFRFADSTDASRVAWNQLPELYWLFEAPDLKPGALPLAVHPFRKAEAGKLPVIVMQRYGAGKILFHATDELWRWRFRIGDEYYRRYWIQALRYLSRATLLGKDRAAELTVDLPVSQRGEPVTLRLSFADDSLAPAGSDNASVLVERRGGSQREVSLSRTNPTDAVFEGQLQNAEAGSYHAWVAAPAFSGAPPSTDFRVESPQKELDNRRLDQEDLKKAADRTFGKYYTLADANQVLADIPAGRTVALKRHDTILLWNRWEFLTLFAALLAAEWILRKRFRLV